MSGVFKCYSILRDIDVFLIMHLHRKVLVFSSRYLKYISFK